MRRRVYATFVVAPVALMMCGSVLGQGSVGSAFTYQGQLKEDGVPANGDYDIKFELYDQPTDGTLIETLIFDGDLIAQNPPPVLIADGLFTVELDFGAGVFTGEGRWLQISVHRHLAIGSYERLSPRQPITTTPYALYALGGPGGTGEYWAANGVDIYNTNGGNVGIGTADPLAKLHVAGGDIRLDLGHELFFQDLGQIRSADGNHRILFRRDENILEFREWGDIFFTPGTVGGEGTPKVVMSSSGNVGIGTTDPSTKLEVLANAAGDGLRITGSSVSGAHLELKGGPSTPGVLQTLGAVDILDSSDALAGRIEYWRMVPPPPAPPEQFDGLSLIVAGTEAMQIRENGAVGIGTGSPLGRLRVEGGNVILASQGEGNVGIGTDDPDTKLQVSGGTDSEPGSGGYLVLGSTSALSLSLDNNEIMARFMGGPSALRVNNDGGDVLISPDGNGNVGIGTSDPGAKLELIAGSGQTGVRATGGEFGVSATGTDTGVEAWGYENAGHFHESGGSGYARLATGDHGVYAGGAVAGGYFSNGIGGEAWLGADASRIDELQGSWEATFGIAARSPDVAGLFEDMSEGTYCTVAHGTRSTAGNGDKSFVQNHPYEQDKVIVYKCLEGDEVGTYTRGTARLENAEARVTLSESFKWVTNPNIGLTAHLTPRDHAVPLAVVSLTTEELIVRGPGNAPDDLVFDYIVHGLRIGFEESSVVTEKRIESYIPSMAAHRELYEKYPELRRFNALERFKTMRTAIGKTEPVDLSEAHALRDAITVYDPAIHNIRHLPGPKVQDIASEEVNREVEAKSAEVLTHRSTHIAQRDDDTEIEALRAESAALRARLESLEAALAELANIKDRDEP